MPKPRMSSRERVLTALNHQEPDRVPFILNGCTSTSMTMGALKNLAQHLNIQLGPIREYSLLHTLPFVDERIMKTFDIDIRPVVALLPKSRFRFQEQNGIRTVFDEWGVGWQRRPDSPHYIPMDNPLKEATLGDLETFPWPDPDDNERFAGVEAEAKTLHENTAYAVYGNVINNNIFLRSTYLRGFEQFLSDLVLDPEFAHAILRKVTDIQKKITANFLNRCGRYLDIFRAGDDLATQSSLIISPDCYRNMIKPYQKDYFSLIKNMTDAKLIYHCCGAIYQAIPDLIEIGVDILNPIQVSCKSMGDTQRLKQEFGSSLSFCGGIDTQHLLPYGKPVDVENEVRRIIKDLAPGGGYLLATVHNIQDDVPVENIFSMFAAGKKYGRYA